MSRKVVLVGVAGLAPVIGWSSQAWACSHQAIITSPRFVVGVAESEVEVSGAQWTVPEVEFRWDTVDGPLLAKAVPVNGVFSVPVKVPNVEGLHDLSVVGRSGTQVYKAVTRFEVVAPASSGTGGPIAGSGATEPAPIAVPATVPFGAGPVPATGGPGPVHAPAGAPSPARNQARQSVPSSAASPSRRATAAPQLAQNAAPAGTAFAPTPVAATGTTAMAPAAATTGRAGADGLVPAVSADLWSGLSASPAQAASLLDPEHSAGRTGDSAGVLGGLLLAAGAVAMAGVTLGAVAPRRRAFARRG